jgi:hypothetical protein
VVFYPALVVAAAGVQVARRVVSYVLVNSVYFAAFVSSRWVSNWATSRLLANQMGT